MYGCWTQIHVFKTLAFLISKRNLKQQRSISGTSRSHCGCIFLGGNLLTLTLLWTFGMFKDLLLSSSPNVGGMDVQWTHDRFRYLDLLDVQWVGNSYMALCPLVNIDIAIEHGRKWQLIYLSRLVIFHGEVLVYQRRGRSNWSNQMKWPSEEIYRISVTYCS